MKKPSVPNIWLVAGLATQLAWSGDWTSPVEVRNEDKLCLTYRARWAADYLVIQTEVEPGWHTFAIDNKRRQQEKLAGKPSLGIERPTEIRLSDGLEVAGPWLQTPPKDFSKPEIRWYTWGFDQQALFAAKVRHTGSGPAKVAIRGQACTESICKNIDVTLALPISNSSGNLDVDLKTLTQVR